MDTNTMLLRMLQLMEARDQAVEEQRRTDRQAAEERRQAAEERRWADLQAAKERERAAEERRRQDMLRMFRAISTRQEEEVLCRQHSEDEPYPVVSSAGRAIGKSRRPRQESNTSITKTEVSRCTVQEPVRVTSAPVTSPVTARRETPSTGQESSGALRNIVSSIPQVLKVPSTKCLEEDAPVARRPRQHSENSENFLPVSECPSPREERPLPLGDARINPQQEPEGPTVIEELSKLPKIAHAEPASSAPFSPPGPGTSLPGGGQPLPLKSPLGMCPEARQFSLPFSPPGPGTSPLGGERFVPPQSPLRMCPEARQFSLPDTSPGLERYPPEGRRFLPRGVSVALPPPEAEEEDVNQGGLPEPDELESKELVGVASDEGTDRAVQKRVPAAIRKLHNSFTGSLHPSVRSRTRSGGHRGGDRDSRTGANARRNWTRSRPHADEKLENGARGFGDDEGGDPRGDGQRSGQRRDEVRRKNR